MQFRTDLAMEQNWQGREGVCQYVQVLGHVQKTEVIVETDQAADWMGKPKGSYITYACDGLYYADAKERMALSRLIAGTLKKLVPRDGDVLIVGLGNRRITADALGSRVLDDLLITRHLNRDKTRALWPGMRNVCALAPGVLGITGMETAEVIRGIVRNVQPSAVIAIDALTARESGRICTTIQIADTGIEPGSGVGNHRLGLTGALVAILDLEQRIDHLLNVATIFRQEEFLTLVIIVLFHCCRWLCSVRRVEYAF